MSYTHSNFGWVRGGGSVGSGTVIQQDITLNDNNVIQYETGPTFITNNSVTTQTINVEEITNNNNTVLFSDGIEVDPLKYNNAYEKSLGSGNTHHNRVIFKDSATCETVLKTDLIQPYQDNTVVVDANCTVNGNFSVLGSSSIISSTNTSFADRYLMLNQGYTTQAALSSGLVGVRLPGNTFVLSGNFTTSTVGTTIADGLAANSIIQIVGSTSNDGLYQVQSHAANVLTIVASPAEPFLAGAFTAEAAAGNAQIVNATALEFKTNGDGLSYVNGSNTSSMVRRNIAYDTSSPTFNSLTVTSVSNNNALTKILCVDNNGLVHERSAASLTGSLSFSNSNDLILPSIETFPLASATPVTGSMLVRRDPVEQRFMSVYIGPFSLTLVAAADYITIPYGNANYDCGIIGSSMSFPIWLRIDSLIEECLLITDRTNFVYKIVRKDLSQFPIGTIDHANFNIAGQPLHTLLTYCKLT